MDKQFPATIVAALAAALVLTACGAKTEKKPGQALANVDGNEITVLQLNEEMQRASVTPAQQEAASKQLLEVLIDRQLLTAQAMKESIDRDPKVVQAIERAKAMIIAQAYLQKHLGNVAKPTRAEIDEYYQKNPTLFSARKLYNMTELVIPARDMNEQVKAAADSSKSLDELAAWFDAHKVKYGRNQLGRTGGDMAPELTARLQTMKPGQIFIIKEPERAMFLTINDVKDVPVTAENAAPQIEQFLFNKRNKEAAESEVARLRSGAKISYVGAQQQAAAGTTGPK